MKQIVIPRHGDLDVLELRESPDPEPSAGEVRIAVQASGVNFADLMARQGIYPDAPPLPMVVGYEVAGVIDRVGEGVDASWEGVPVLAMTRFKGYSSHVVVPVEQAVRRPETLDPVTAASIPVTGVTSWMMLEEIRRVREGDRVLVHSAGGGVGLMALDLIKRRGGIAIGTASASKHAFLKERGYDQLIDYRNEDFEEVLRDDPPLDCILDPIGGDSWAKGLRLLSPAGALICFGFSSRSGGSQKPGVFKQLSEVLAVPWMKFNPVSLMHGNQVVGGVNMGRMWGERERVSGWLASLVELWEHGVIRPKIHAAVPFVEPAEAHRILHDRENLGKVILVQDGVTWSPEGEPPPAAAAPRASSEE
ncbi:MAG: alcohol dehydrogenase [Deltaproteobacteria bacterium]|nr:MAG: alcohol dehydrogenase [Deltaproteobacteria bacterium]